MTFAKALISLLVTARPCHLFVIVRISTHLRLGEWCTLTGVMNLLQRGSQAFPDVSPSLEM